MHNQPSLTIVLAPDKFTGWKSAPEICAMMENGITEYFNNRMPELPLNIIHAPMADGGIGTIEVLHIACGGQIIDVAGILNPLGEPVTASYLQLPDGTAVIEMAKVSGIHFVRTVHLGPHGWQEIDRRDPLRATTFGIGQLLKYITLQAHLGNCTLQRIILGIGGGATNDGGIGCLQALGVQFFTGGKVDLPIAAGGGSLESIEGLENSKLIQLEEIKLIIACDVDNPLLGPRGATLVYGPQKGVTPELSPMLEGGMRHYSQVMEAWTRLNRSYHSRVLSRHFPLSLTKQFRDIPGTGSGGGLPYGLLCVYEADLQPGAKIIAEAVNLSEKIRNAQIVITGEGRMDSQTLSGKVPLVVAQMASPIRRKGPFISAIAGSVAPDFSDSHNHFDLVLDASNGKELSWLEIQTDGEANLRQAVRQMLDHYCARNVF